MLFIEIAVIFFISFTVYYNWTRRHLYILSWKLPGAFAYPIVGNGLLFSGPVKDLLKKLRQLTQKYKHPLRIWIGPKLFIFFSSAQHTEQILLSSKLTQKHDLYEFLKPILGDGLINSSGPTWRKQRKLIQPIFSAAFVMENEHIIQSHLDKCVIKLRTRVNGESFNINEDIHRCASDMITEVMMGESFNVQFSKEKEHFFRAATDGYDLVISRLLKPWKHPDILYQMQDDYSSLKRVIHDLHTTTREMIRKSRKEIHLDFNQRCSFLDKIIHIANNNPGVISDDTIMYQLITIYLASEDTIAAVTSFACLCFGMYLEYQEAVYEEIRSVIENNGGTISINDLNKLPYLDMCVKDILRLAPVGPFIIRQPYEDFEIDDLKIPPNCGILLSIMDVHYDPSHWENPTHFHPDHFLPEVAAKRHPYAYVPFSAGPRGCIGKIVANAAIKLALVSILRNFRIHADGKLPDIELKMDISIRPVGGYMVRLKKRH